MKFVLMHQNIAVALIEIDEDTGLNQEINELYEVRHLPYGVKVKSGVVDRATLND